MKTRFTAIDKLITSIAAFAMIMWLGGSIIRTLVTYDLYQPGTLIFKNYSLDAQNQTIHLISNMTLYIDVSYAFVILATIYLLCRFHHSMKEHGWMFMSAVMLLLTVIPNLILIYQDYLFTVGVTWWDATFEAQLVIDYLTFKFVKYSILEPMVMLAGMTAVILIVCRPLNGIFISKPKKPTE